MSDIKCKKTNMDLAIIKRTLLFLMLFVYETTPAKNKVKPSPPVRSHEHRLVQDMFKHYETSVRPRYDSSETVDVAVRFSLQQINDLDEKRQILKMSGWLTAEWHDDFLRWNPDDYGGMKTLVVDPTKLWVPKLAIGNSANRLFDPDHYKRFWITVRHNGTARWQPGGVFAISCALDMNFYPFDDQKCMMEIETWVYTADKVNITSSYAFIGLDTYISHGEWTILKTEAKSKNRIYRYYVDEQFPEVYFIIYMRRKHTFYFMYILLPCLMLSGVLLMVFQLPADSGEKVSMGVSIMVAISVFLLLVAGNVPDTSDAIPIIAIYLTFFMMITTLSVACAVFVIKLHYTSPETDPPQWLRTLLFNYVARLVCMDPDGKLRKLSMQKKKPKNTRMPLSRDLTTLTWPDAISPDEQSSYAPYTSTSRGHEDMEEMYELRRGNCTPVSVNHGTAAPIPNASYPTSQGHQQYPAGNPRHRPQTLRTCYAGENTHGDHMQSTTLMEGNGNQRGSGCSGSRLENNIPMDLTSPCTTISRSNTLHSFTSQSNKPAPLNEWKKLADILDRFLFYMFLVFLIVPTAIILGIVRLFKPEL